ncbi:MAG: hypothetical protein MUC92_02930 [Fimbriimonadaceae bacterium]|jgi:hypothetical protein|nr:hypothetical protein [Fimbriimonadaceae bacterium]
MSAPAQSLATGVPAAPKKKGKLVKVILVVLVVLLLAGGGAVFFLAQKGIVKIPGISPKKSSAALLYKPDAEKASEKAPAPPTKQAQVPAVTKPKNPQPPADEGPKPDPAKGAKKVATLWDGIEKEQLLKIASEYRDPDLALILSKMDPEKAGEVLTGLDPKRAAKVSKEIERLAASPSATP